MLCGYIDYLFCADSRRKDSLRKLTLLLICSYSLWQIFTLKNLQRWPFLQTVSQADMRSMKVTNVSSFFWYFTSVKSTWPVKFLPVPFVQ